MQCDVGGGREPDGKSKGRAEGLGASRSRTRTERACTVKIDDKRVRYATGLGERYLQQSIPTDRQPRMDAKWAENESGPPPTLFTSHSPLPNLLLPLPLVNHTSSLISPITSIATPTSQPGDFTCRILYQLSTASHVILRRNMPCQTGAPSMPAQFQCSNTRRFCREAN